MASAASFVVEVRFSPLPTSTLPFLFFQNEWDLACLNDNLKRREIAAPSFVSSALVLRHEFNQQFPSNKAGSLGDMCQRSPLFSGRDEN